MKENAAANNTYLANEWKQEAGPLKPFLNDPSVSEIMVNAWDRIFVERKGIIEEIDTKFKGPDSLTQFVQSLCAYLGRELNRKFPYLDGRLPDGSRINIVIPPIALDGPVITIRKAAAAGQALDYKSLVKAGALNDKCVYFLNLAVSTRQNIVISGGTGSGKTTILNVLSAFIHPRERVVSIEDTAELQLNVKNHVRLETRPELANETQVTVNELLRNALRMRPDRILIGECRGAEAMDMMIAMNTGHEGSMTTIHANTASDALRRLEVMVLRASTEVPLAVIQADIANTIHFVIQADRGSDGRRRVTEVLEVQGRQGSDYKTASIFKYDPTEGLVSTGLVPSFVTQGHASKFPQGFFDPSFTVKLSQS